MVVYSRGETCIHRVTIRDENNNLFDPDTVTITIYDPSGNTVVDNQTMTKQSTGVYQYGYNIPSNAKYGEYRIVVKMTITGTSTTIQEDEFFILPIRLEEVKQVSGIRDENSISDKDFSQLLWHAYQIALKEAFIKHYDEEPKGNPDTGVWLDGSNKTFQVRHPPIADANGDGTVDGDDITAIWVDEDYNVHSLTASVVNAREGIITLEQTDGSAIPSTAKKVRVDYYQEPPRWDSNIFEKAVTFLASHLAQMRLKEPSRITIADLESNRTLMDERHTEFLDMYRMLMRRLYGGGFTVS